MNYLGQNKSMFEKYCPKIILVIFKNYKLLKALISHAQNHSACGMYK